MYVCASLCVYTLRGECFFNREQLCFTRLHVIQDDTKSEVVLDLHLLLILCTEGQT